MSAPEVTFSERGFKHLAPTEDTYGGVVRVYESSSAAEPCIWLRVTHGPHMDAANAAANLTIEQALQVAEHLQWLAANHYQLPVPPEESQ